MGYAQPSDLQDRYPTTRLAELSDQVGVVVQNAKLQTALDDASAEMDSYLGRRYSLPLAAVPAVLERLCCDIAVYRLMALLPKEVVQDARRRFEDALAWLDDLATGRIFLPDLKGVELSAGSSIRIVSSGNDRIFSSDTFSDYQ